MPRERRSKYANDAKDTVGIASQVESLSSSLAQNMNIRDYRGFGEIKLPSDFVPKLPFSLFRDFDGIIKHNYNLSQFETDVTQTIHCSSLSGSDGSGTGAEATPYATLKKALQVAVASTETKILIKVEGNMLKDTTPDLTITGKTIAIVPKSSGKIFVSCAVNNERPFGQTVTWTADENIYTCARTNCNNVVDLTQRDVYGIAKPLEWAASVAECKTKLNSFYSNGANVWVNVGRVPDKEVQLLLNAPNFAVTLVSSTLYVRDLEFYSGTFNNTGGHSCRIAGGTGGLTSTFINHKCFFVGGEGQNDNAAGSNNGLNLSNVGKSYSFESIAAYTRRDGFNYHYEAIPTADRRKCLAFEYRCIGYENGRYEVNVNNNATTAHEGISVLRVAGIGYKAKGPLCADVNGCYSIVIDGSYYDSTCDPRWDNCAGYYFDNASATVNGKAVLINCEGGSEKYSISGGTGFDVQIRNFVGKKVKSDLVLSYLA
jgi:hypothetical protein